MTAATAKTASQFCYWLTKPAGLPFQHWLKPLQRSTDGVYRLWIAIQSLSQLDAVYGRVHARILRDNMDSQLYYRPCDLETAEYLQKYLGFQSGYAQSETTHEGTVSSNGRSERKIPLLTAQAIKQLDDEDVIIFHRNLALVKAHRMDWRKFPELVIRL